VTLTGPGGTGKTRLALRAASELARPFTDGVYFVDLAPVREPEGVPAAIARTIGLRETSDRPLMDKLEGQLHARSMLLLLDNFEQVTSAAPMMGQLLENCSHLKLLVTSREALRLRGEHIYPVPPLGVPGADRKQQTIEQLTQYEAVRLFIDRVLAVKPDFEVTNENAPAIAEICFQSSNGSSQTFTSEFLLLKGTLLLALSSDNAAEAKVLYEQGVLNAQEVHAPMLELRAAIGLSRLCQEQGDNERARKVLSEAYSKITEGFATPDLKEATTLLADLSEPPLNSRGDRD
jgi:predicted ATPase